MGKDKKQKKNLAAKEKSDDLANIDKLNLNENKGAKEESMPEENKKTEKLELDEEDSEIEIITLEQQGKRKKKAKPGKPSFSVLEIEGENINLNDSTDDEHHKEKKGVSADAPEEKDQSKSEVKAGKKKKKKDRKKRDDSDDDDLQKMLEELALEMGGSETQTTERTKGNETINLQAESIPENEKHIKKKKEEKKNEIPTGEDLKASSPDAAGTVPTVKTAAQKKKEKKEREREKERQKKIAQLEQTTSKKKPDMEEEKRSVSPESLKISEDNIAGDAKNLEEEDKEEDADSKKKKKKKKKEEEEKKDKKRPGKKQIEAMKEALRRVKEEEERLRLEEEAKIRAAEEAEKLRQEQLRLEEEKKAKKKQKEKEKRERLKAEGKLLSKTQRQNRARMEATLAVLREKGIEVPNIGGDKKEKEKGPRLGDRRKDKKRKSVAEEKESSSEVSQIEELNVANKATENEPAVEEPTENKKSPSVSDNENIKDAWYETSDEESSQQEHQNEAKKLSESESESESSDSENSKTSDESESDESEDSSDGEKSKNDAQSQTIDKIKMRIKKRREVAETNRSMSQLRSPIVCVLGHVDTGKTKILDKIRNTSVQAGEAGGITQQIGATMVPHDALKQQCQMVKNFSEMSLKVPGLLIIDTPGHESFSNLRSRGSSLCDIAVLVVDILHGLEPQTIESLNILKQRKTPFVVALNKIDRLYEWKTMKNKDIEDIIKGQSRTTRQFFDDRVKQIILEFANQSLNAVLYYENKDPRTFISMVPTSALTGEGVGNLMSLILELTQSMMAKKLQFSEELEATVLEVKAISGLGHTMDVILVNGRLREADTIIFAGYDGPVCSQIRSLLMPHPLKELRVKTQFVEHREVEGAQGVKICGKDLDRAIAGLPLLVARRSDEVEILMDEISSLFKEAMNSIKVTATGVYVQTSTLGSLEALMEFLNESKIPVSGVRIGPVTKRDVMKASAMLEHDPTYAVILAFDVRIEREAQELADSLNIKIFHANIIYHLFDMFVNYRTELKEKNREMFKSAAVFPCKLRILPQFIFNSRDPIVVGVSIEAGILKEGTPLCVPSKEFLDIGTVSTIEVNHKQIETARKGAEVCIKIEPCGGEAPKMYGRHFDHTDLLVSKISRYSIDMCKEHFRDDLLKTDWQLIVELKKLFQIL